MCGKASSNSSILAACPASIQSSPESLQNLNLRKFGGKITLGERGPSISKSLKMTENYNLSLFFNKPLTHV